jgi:hypothetical protein
MSGTIGITAHPGVRTARRTLAGRLRAIRTRGGFTAPVAVPVALAITAGTTWAVVTMASRVVSW